MKIEEIKKEYQNYLKSFNKKDNEKQKNYLKKIV